MYSLVRAIDILVNAYVAMLFIYCMMTWIPAGATKSLESVRNAMAALCEPFLGLFRKLIPSLGGIDFSPIVAILVLQLVWRFLRPILL